MPTRSSPIRYIRRGHLQRDVTEARKEKFDFSTYRVDALGLYVAADNVKIRSITEPKDVAGLKVIVSSGTNQEQILLNWVKKNKDAGLTPTEIEYYDDSAVRHLALESGRADADLEPNATEAFYAVQNAKTKLVGIVNGGWPLTAEIAVATKKGSGLAMRSLLRSMPRSRTAMAPWRTPGSPRPP